MSKTVELGIKKYITSKHYFIKSEYYLGEQRSNGREPNVWRWSAQRLKNEAAALRLIKDRTTIPVPDVYSCQRDDRGAMRLVVQRINGVEAASIGEECQMPEGSRHASAGTCYECKRIVAEKVNAYIEGKVLPQLQALTSSQTGLDGFVLPPPRIEQYDGRDTWTPKRSSREDAYVFCHGDLSRSNIMVDPKTLDVTYIIDWEQAGFFPTQLERPLWRLDYDDYMRTYMDTSELDREIALITESDEDGKGREC